MQCLRPVQPETCAAPAATKASGMPSCARCKPALSTFLYFSILHTLGYRPTWSACTLYFPLLPNCISLLCQTVFLCRSSSIVESGGRKECWG